MTRKLKFGLIAACLTVFLSACSARPCRQARPVLPPAVLMQEVQEPTLTGKTNADLVRLAVELQSALRLANSDKRALREWLARME